MIKLLPGVSVKCKIDRNYRFQNSQQHTGQHLLSAIAQRLFDVDSTSFKIALPLNTIEFSRKCDQTDIQKLEDEINSAILHQTVVSSAIYTDKQAIPENIRKDVDKLEVPIRVVTISNYDDCPCCGTHVQSVQELQICKIFQLENTKRGCKIWFLFGRRCIEKMNFQLQQLKLLTDSFTTGDDKIVESCLAAREEMKEWHKRSDEWLRIASRVLVQQERYCYGSEWLVVVLRQDSLTKEEASIIAGALAEEPFTNKIIAYVTEHATQLIVLCLDSKEAKDAIVKKLGNVKGGGNQQRLNFNSPDKLDDVLSKLVF